MTIQLRKPPTKKLPHEKLRDIDPYTGCVMIGGDEVAGLTQKEGNIVASEIEKYYDPKPRDIKGNPVYKGMEVEGGTVHTWCVFGDGSWDLYDEDYVPIQSGGLCDLIRLPEPKVLDADGVPTKKGDKVWDLTPETRDTPFWNGELWVVDITKDNIVVAPFPGSGATLSAPSRCFSHARPQYDRNGVLCKPGDTVFGLGREQHRYKVLSEELDVEKCEPYNHGRFTLPCLDLTEGDESVCFLDPRMVSHKEPGSYEELQEMLREESPKGDGDSYEKLRDDLKRKYGSNSQWVERLTAIMERDA